MLWPILLRSGARQPVWRPRRIRSGKSRPESADLVRTRRRWVSRRRRRAEEAQAARAVLAVLELQVRLSKLTRLLREIDVDPGRYARQHHWRTTLWAYDAVLGDACAVAGIEVREASAGPAAAEERMRRELELYACGWNW